MSLPGSVESAFDLSGSQLAHAPECKRDQEIAYTIHGDPRDFTLRANAVYTSLTYFSQFNESFVARNGYGRLDLYLNVTNR